MPRFSDDLEKTVERAFTFAKMNNRELVTIEDLLLALTDDRDASNIMAGCGISIDSIRTSIAKQVNDISISENKRLNTTDPQPTAGFRRVMNRSIKHVSDKGGDLVDGGNVLISIFSERDSSATKIMNDHGLTRLDAVKFMSAKDIPSDQPLKPERDQSEDSEQKADPSAWTGIRSRADRLAAAKMLIPTAQGAIENLIFGLENRSHNGGPPLDEMSEAIAALRELHGKLGELLEAIDAGRFDTDLGDGLISEAIKVSQRVGQNLQNDPLPYAAASLLMSIFFMLGQPAIGAWLSAFTFQATKK